MNETIELALESPDGIIDCRLEPQDDNGTLYAATILYPSGGGAYSRSDIFCHDMRRNAEGGYEFENSEDIHPKIVKLASQLSAAIMKAQK